MKCTNKRIISILLVCSIVLSGCGSAKLDNEYNIKNVSSSGNAKEKDTDSTNLLLSEKYCVADDSNILLDDVNTDNIKAAGAFNITKGECLYAYNVQKKLYPASTTKILTAYLAITKGNLKDVVTVSSEACTLPYGASTASLQAGDEVTVEDLLYGLMLVSGNDAANALAEYVSGSVADFATLMNETCMDIASTKSEFVNPNGLHDDEHYTSCYDLYLIFQTALENKTFRKIIHTLSYDASIKRASGEVVSINYGNTNKFLNGSASYPKGYKIIGGKTGTTNDAGNCLVLLVKNKEGDEIILIGLGADSRDNLYLFLDNLMNSLKMK